MGNIQRYINYGKIILIMLTVIALGLFAVNMFLKMHYGLQLIEDPCVLCNNRNPQLRECVMQILNSPDNIIKQNYSNFSNIDINSLIKK